MPQRQWSSHVQGSAHRNKERLNTYRTVKEEAEKDKHGVTVSQMDFGIVDVVDARRTVSQILTMRTTVPGSRIVVVDYRLSVSSATPSPYVPRLKYVFIKCANQSRSDSRSPFPEIPSHMADLLWVRSNFVRIILVGTKIVLKSFLRTKDFVNDSSLCDHCESLLATEGITSS
jgi:hypothetical protein